MHAFSPLVKWYRLNSNIRCIEITDDVYQGENLTPLNSNIRCIEMVLDSRDMDIM